MAASSIVFVYTLNRINQPGRWSRYVFPFKIEYFAQLGSDLYIRAGNDVLRMDKDAIYDFAGDTQVPSRQQGFDGIVQWPWLDFGSPGVTKRFDGFDIVGTGVPQVSFGYDQNNPGAFTDAYTVSPDTVPGMLVPIPLMTPSASVKVFYAGGQQWSLNAMNIWIWNMRDEA